MYCAPLPEAVEQSNEVKFEDLEQIISGPRKRWVLSRRSLMTMIIVAFVGLVVIGLIVGIKEGVGDRKSSESRYLHLWHIQVYGQLTNC